MATPMDAETIHRRRWAILGVMSLSLVIVMLNNATLNVALPELSKDLNASNSQLQWIVDAYVLVFGGTLLLMGALGDRFGRKGALQLGLAIVAIVAAWTALYAETANQVITARALMGVGAALVMPATLSVIVVVFPKEERGRAMGIWAAMAGIGAPLGLLVGGWLVESYDWTYVFWINVPTIILALGLGVWLVPRSRDDEQKPIDVTGAALSVVGFGTLLFAIIEGPEKGWTSLEVLGSFAVAALTIGGFVWWEVRTPYPLLPMGLFRNRGFTLGLVAISLAFFAMFSFMFLQMLHLQLVRGHTAFEAAVRILPMILGMMMTAPRSDTLVERIGTSKTVGAGLVIIALALSSFFFAEVDTNYWVLAAGFFGLGFGLGLTMAPSTTIVMDSIPTDKAGVGSATNDTSRELGGALGIAILGSVLNELYQNRMELPAGYPAGMPDAPLHSFPAAVRIGQQLNNPVGDALVLAAQEAFMAGMQVSALASAGVALLAAVLVFRFMPDRQLEDAPSSAADAVAAQHEGAAGGDGDPDGLDGEGGVEGDGEHDSTDAATDGTVHLTPAAKAALAVGMVADGDDGDVA